MSELEQDVEHVRAVTEALGGNKVWCVDEEHDGSAHDTQIFWSKEGACAHLAARVRAHAAHRHPATRADVEADLADDSMAWNDDDKNFFIYERAVMP